MPQLLPSPRKAFHYLIFHFVVAEIKRHSAPERSIAALCMLGRFNIRRIHRRSSNKGELRERQTVALRKYCPESAQIKS